MREGDRVAEGPAADAWNARGWLPARDFDEFARICCGHPHLRLLADLDSFLVSQRVGRIGPVTLSEIAVGSDLPMDGGQVCGSYRVVVVQAGRTEALHQEGNGTLVAKCSASRSPAPLSMMLSAMRSVGR